MLLPTSLLANGQPPLPLASPTQGGMSAGGPPPANEAKPIEILNAMLQLATLYRAVEPDQQDKLTMEKVSTLVQQLVAKDEADQRQTAGPQGLPFAGR